jgi:hypothetical protein
MFSEFASYRLRLTTSRASGEMTTTSMSCPPLWVVELISRRTASALHIPANLDPITTIVSLSVDNGANDLVMNTVWL